MKRNAGERGRNPFRIEFCASLKVNREKPGILPSRFIPNRLSQFCLIETVPISGVSPLETVSGTGFHVAVAKKQVHRLRLSSVRMAFFRFFQIRRAGGNHVLALVGEDGLTGNAEIALLQRPSIFMQMRAVAACALRHGKPSASVRLSSHPPTMKNNEKIPKPLTMISIQIFHRLYPAPFSAVFPKPLIRPLKLLRPHRTKPNGNGSCHKAPQAMENQFLRPTGSILSPAFLPKETVPARYLLHTLPPPNPIGDNSRCIESSWLETWLD